jgi:sulfur carrier protein
MQLTLNGTTQNFDTLLPGATLQDFLDHLALKGDRIAVELNGNIVSRPAWSTTPLSAGDKLEVVHFVGGGTQ